MTGLIPVPVVQEAFVTVILELYAKLLPHWSGVPFPIVVPLPADPNTGLTVIVLLE
jgi:hypothetical protein